MGAIELDEVDERILKILDEDARRPAADIAGTVGISEDEVEERIDRLRSEDIITKFTTILNTDKLGYISVAFGFSVAPGQTDEIAEALSKYENIYKLWILSGRHNIIAHANFTGIDEFQEFSSEALHNIDGITDYESSIATKTVVNEGDVMLSVHNS